MHLLGSHIFFGERRPSGIAGWRGGWIARIGSEGTRDALLPASPVPERRTTVGFKRTTGRPAISCTALLAIISSFLTEEQMARAAKEMYRSGIVRDT
jgi:hypothetical protein